MATEKHFVVVAFPAFGHIIPLLELAKKIHQKHRVTFVISTVKLLAMNERHLLPENLTVVTYEDDYDQDLEPTELMAAVRKILIPLTEIFKGISTSQGSVETPVTAVIMDFMFTPGFEVCHSLNIPAYMFACCGAWPLIGNLSIDENTPTVSDEDWFNPDSDVDRKPMTMAITAGLRDMWIGFTKSYPLLKAVVMNSFEDLEPTAKLTFERHSKSGGTPMKFVGPVFSEEVVNSETTRVKNWLDQRERQSVVFISFGSMAIPLPEQIAEIAEALTALKKPFIWSLRTSQHNHLPGWFLQQMKKIGDEEFLVLPWAPQKTILGHPALQVFVSHCGWNSCMEGIYSGVPFVCWPMFGDQPCNADFLTNLGVAVKIPNTSLKATRVVPKSELMEAITKVTIAGDANGIKSYSKIAHECALKARAAVSEGGKSWNDFEELFG